MPDQYNFNHEAHRGMIYHRCIDCDEFPWGVRVNEKERARHFKKHDRVRQHEVERKRKAALKKARTALKLAREG